jgi:hypothetical protein
MGPQFCAGLYARVSAHDQQTLPIVQCFGDKVAFFSMSATWVATFLTERHIFIIPELMSYR